MPKIIHHVLFIILTGIMFAAALPPGAGTARAQSGGANAPRFTASACPFANPTRFTIDCGWLTVPEDHAQPDGSTIQLAVAIIRANAPAPLPDPLVFLAGGPGAGIVQTAPLVAAQFGFTQVTRDTILIDQRGMGLSQPALYCPEITPGYLMTLINQTAADFAPIRDCRARLAAQGVNLSAYTTAQNAADIAALRVALGLPQVNLSGVSYGTKLALTVLRDHPDGIRSVILDSTLPLDVNVSGAEVSGFERAFDLLAGQCAADALCGTMYPDVRGTYLRLFEALNAQPVTLQSAGVTFTFNGQLLQTMVFLMLYRPASFAAVPGMLYDVAAGDYRPVVAWAKGPATDGASRTSIGTQFTITCGESAAHMTYAGVQAAQAALPPAFASPIYMTGTFGYRLCEAWGMPAPEPTPNLLSDVPTLILAGAFDPVTPPSFGQQAAARLSRGHYLEFAYQGHGVTTDACALRAVYRFSDDPTRAPDVDCVTALPPFTLTAAPTRTPLALLTLLTTGAALVGVGALAWAWARLRTAGGTHYRFAWRAAFRVVGAAAPLIAVALLTMAATGSDALMSGALTMVQAVIPLILGVQAAAVLSPDDEPGIEMLLTYPRPLAWLLVERLGAAALLLAGVGVAGTGVSLALAPGQSLAEAFARWLAPALLFAGLGVYVTLRARVMLFGMLVIGLVGFGFQLAGDLFLPGEAFPVPLNVVQPFLWALHPFLAPDALLPGDFWLNRLLLAALGVGLLLLALRELRDEEQVLLRVSGRALKRAAKQEAEGFKPSYHW